MEVDDTLLHQELSNLDSDIKTLEQTRSKIERKLLELNIRRDVISDLTQGRISSTALTTYTRGVPPPPPTPAPTPPPTQTTTPPPSRLDAVLSHIESQQPLEFDSTPPAQPAQPAQQPPAQPAPQPAQPVRAPLNHQIWASLGPFLEHQHRTASECYQNLIDDNVPVTKRQSLYVAVSVLRAKRWLLAADECDKGYYGLTGIGEMNIGKNLPSGSSAAVKTQTKANTQAKTQTEGTRKKTERSQNGKLNEQNKAMLRFIGVTKEPTLLDVMDHLDRIGKPVDSRDQLSRQIHKCRNPPHMVIKKTADVMGTHYELTEEGMRQYGPDNDFIVDGDANGNVAQPEAKTVSVLPRVIDPDPTSVIGNALSDAQKAVIDTDMRKQQIAQINKGNYGRKRRKQRA